MVQELLEKNNARLNINDNQDQEQEITILSTKLRQLENELKILEQENELTNKRFLDIVSNLEHKVKEKNQQLYLSQSLITEKNKELNLMLNNAPALIYYKDAELAYIQVNQKFLSFFNLAPSSILGKKNNEIITDIDLFSESYDIITLNSKKPSNNIIETFKYEGNKYYFSVDRIPIIDSDNTARGIVCFAQNISEKISFEQEKSKFEEQLRQNQKIEALGTLASGIAHDFNNILSAINGYAEMAAHVETSPENITKYIDAILKAGLRAKELTRQILSFSRKKETKFSPINVIDIIEDVKKIVRPSLPSSINLEFIKKTDQAIIFADATQIHQVFMNLCTNAFQAIKSSKGKITIIIDKQKLEDDNPLQLEAGDYQVIQIMDDGEGIQESKLKQIFEPYYTSKKCNEGTGLGLSIVSSIVRTHKGEITVKSKLGEGTTFTTYLPTLDSLQTDSSEKNLKYINGCETILVIDDEESVVALMDEFLSYLGYNVIAHSDSVEAMNIFEKQPDRFQAVITDMTMPKITGLEVVEKVRSINENVPIILASGYFDTMEEEMISGIKNLKFIKKPYELSSLSHTLYDMIKNQNVLTNF